MSRYYRVIAMGLMLVSISCFAFIRHEVKRGETLWGLSHKYNVSPEQITKYNPKANNGLKIGMVLNIPEPSDTDNAVNAEEPVNVQEPVKDYGQPQVVEQAPAKTVEQAKPKKESRRKPKTLETTDRTDQTIPESETVNAPEPTITDQAIIDDTITESTMSEDSLDEVVTAPAGLYKARFGDSLAGISAKTGVPLADLIRNNPLIDADHVSEGYMVRLSEDSPYVPYGADLTTVDSIIYRVQPQVTFRADSNRAETTIAVMLPFDLENDVIGQKSLLATEFYKGFLMATHKATENRDLPIRIIAIDTQCDSIHFDDKLRKLVREKVNVIIPPDDDSQLEKIEAFALNNNAVVLNVLNIKDEGYLSYPNVIQCNISQKQMYDKAVRALMDDFSEYTPVVLDLAGGKDEKNNFIELLNSQCDAQGRRVINLSFKNKLEVSDIKNLGSGKYIFIPKSGTSDVFNKISEALVAITEEDPASESYKVFGYPDWIAFRGEQEDALHRMGANIYSRFYFDQNDFRNEDANQEYSRWFGGEMEEVFPSQGLLGYDAGEVLYQALRKKYDGTLVNKFTSGSYEGVQSAFKFGKGGTEASGLVNESLYIIEYLPGQVLYVKVI